MIRPRSQGLGYKEHTDTSYGPRLALAANRATIIKEKKRRDTVIKCRCGSATHNDSNNQGFILLNNSL